MDITPDMRAVNDVLFQKCVGMDHCLIQKERNLIVEVPRSKVNHVIDVLKQSFPDVVDIRRAYLMLPDLHGFILVKPMISEAPVFICDSVSVPTLEKELVDRMADKEYENESKEQKEASFMRSFEVYEINSSRLLRYAGRKGKKEEVLAAMDKINDERVTMIHSIQEVLASTPIEKAWLFGSYSRREERPDSDIDLLIDLDRQHPIGLFELGQLSLRLEEASGKEVDLVVNGAVKEFARKNIDHDKILIYERAV